MHRRVGHLVCRRADGGVMASRRIGQGPPIVCLAGGPAADARYLENLAGLDLDHELIIPDLGGTGRSDPPRFDSGYGFDSIAVELESLRSHLGLDTMTVIAHSAACTSAATYAAEHAQRVARLVLIAPSRWLHPEVEDDTRTILRRRAGERWYADAVAAFDRLGAGPDPSELPALVAATAPSFYARWGSREQEHSASTLPEDWGDVARFWQPEVDIGGIRESLARVAAPVLVVTGDLDAATGVAQGDAWADSFPMARHVTIAGSGHVPWVDQPDAFASTVRGFLEATPG